MSSPKKVFQPGTEPTPEAEPKTLVYTAGQDLSDVDVVRIGAAETEPSSPLPPEVVAVTRRSNEAVLRSGTLPSAQTLEKLAPFEERIFPKRKVPTRAASPKTPERSPINEMPAVVKRRAAIQGLKSSRYVRDAILVILVASATYGITKYISSESAVDESEHSSHH